MIETNLDLFFFLFGNYIQYFVIAGIIYLVFWKFLRKKLKHLFIMKKFPKKKHIDREIKYSIISLTITKIFGGSIILFYYAGYTLIYDEINEYGMFYTVLSFFLAIFIHDTYFYWTHRLMHHPKIYRKVHLVHHKSINPSPWAAFAFHPYEALISGLIIPVLIFVLPMHMSVVVLFFLFSLVKNIWGHLGYELFPSGFTKSKLFGVNTTTTHHSLHHKKFNGNYGFYFTFWDRIMKTEVEKYHEEFESVATRDKDNYEKVLSPKH